MTYIIGKGRYARETYPLARASTSLQTVLAAWDIVPDENAGGEFSFVDTTGSVAFRHPKTGDQVATQFLETVWPAGRLVEGDTLFVSYSGTWLFLNGGDPAILNAHVAFAVLISTDNGTTWVIDNDGLIGLNLASNTDDNGAAQPNISRRWAVTVPPIADATQNIIVGVALNLQTPEGVGGSPPSITHEGEEGGGRLIVERFNPSLIVDFPGATNWFPIIVSAPPWAPP